MKKIVKYAVLGLAQDFSRPLKKKAIRAFFGVLCAVNIVGVQADVAKGKSANGSGISGATQPAPMVRLDPEKARGYVHDVPYPDMFIDMQTPTSIAKALTASSYVGVPIGQKFRYLDLGAGQCQTVIELACIFPYAEFWAIDMIPAHIANAKKRIQQLGLTNVHVLQATFADIVQGRAQGLPMQAFDMVVAHGVLSWIHQPVAHEMLKVAQKTLKPSGYFYVSYNAYPGWAVYEPTNVLVRTLAGEYQGLSTGQFAKAVQHAQDLAQKGAEFFRVHPRASQKLNAMQQHDPAYLVHEYMNQAQNPYYGHQVRDMLQPYGLTYAADTRVLRTYPQIFLAPELAKECSLIKDPVRQEIIKDFCGNTNFRRDVFAGSDAKRIPIAQAATAMPFCPFVFARLPGMHRATPMIQVNANQFPLDTGIGRTLIAFLDQHAGQAFSLAELRAKNPELKALTGPQLMAHLHLLDYGKQVAFLVSTAGLNTWKRCGQQAEKTLWTAHKLTYDRWYQAVTRQQNVFVPSPALGERFVVTPDQALCALVIVKGGGSSASAGRALYELHSQLYGGVTPADRSVAVNSPEAEAIQYWQKIFQDFCQNTLPLWVMLGLLQPVR